MASFRSERSYAAPMRWRDVLPTLPGSPGRIRLVGANGSRAATPESGYVDFGSRTGPALHVIGVVH